MSAVSPCAVFMCVVALLTPVRGHGRLVEPPSRSSMWRFGFNNPANYNDNQLFCGGFHVQYYQNQGQCGVCGDNAKGAHDNEYPGKYANGIIVRKYTVGQDIDVIVHLTANHRGWFEFRLCQNDAINTTITHACLDKHLLVIRETGTTRYYVDATKASYYAGMNVTLPAGLTCADCVLQWKYNSGNNWGTDPDGTSGVGKGDQEQFYGCADVAIGHDEVPVGPTNDVVDIPAGDTDDRLAWDKMNADRQTTNVTDDDDKDCACKCTGSHATANMYSSLMLIAVTVHTLMKCI